MIPCESDAYIASNTYGSDSDRFIEYLLEREDVKPVWHKYTHHEFVQRMGDGTLPLETFKYYMIQDYLYLVRESLCRRAGRY